MRRILPSCLVLALTACADSALVVTPPPEAPLSVHSGPAAGPRALAAAGRYIVTLERGSSATEVAQAHGVTPDFVYRHALNGFAGPISDAARARLLADSRVVRVEPDGIAYAVDVQPNPTWGLDRVDQRPLPLDMNYYFNRHGTGVTVYVLDTGIRFTHNEFGGRATSGADYIDGGTADDCNGHGTHVAGTVGGATYGVAKNVSVVAVRVLNCQGSGFWSQVIAGIDWVTANHVKPAVANMSLGGTGVVTSVGAAVLNSILAGVSYSLAAGNNNDDACNFTPAYVAEAMTIGATNSTDARASFSNWGSCTDWFAPGVSITSAWWTRDDATNTISGTSMAAPHVAGVAALYLQSFPTANPATVRDALFAAATKDIVQNALSPNDHLVFSRLFNNRPSASFNWSCGVNDCSFEDKSTDSDGKIVQWFWDFADGTTSTEQKPVHIYPAEVANYEVTLTVTDDLGGTHSFKKWVLVCTTSLPSASCYKSA